MTYLVKCSIIKVSITKFKGGEELTEKELVTLLKKGDRGAFNTLIEEYQNKVINIAYGMLSDTEDAMDASQEVFINVYKSIGNFKENSSLSTWIYRICANVCKDFLRKRMRSAKTVSIFSPSDEENETIEIPDESSSPHERFEELELKDQIREAIAELSEEFRTVLVLCDIEGLSYDKIAEILKCPAGTVKSRINRARSALRKKILEKRELFNSSGV